MFGLQTESKWVEQIKAEYGAALPLFFHIALFTSLHVKEKQNDVLWGRSNCRHVSHVDTTFGKKSYQPNSVFNLWYEKHRCWGLYRTNILKTS